MHKTGDVGFYNFFLFLDDEPVNLFASINYQSNRNAILFEHAKFYFLLDENAILFELINFHSEKNTILFEPINLSPYRERHPFRTRTIIIIMRTPSFSNSPYFTLFIPQNLTQITHVFFRTKPRSNKILVFQSKTKLKFDISSGNYTNKP